MRLITNLIIGILLALLMWGCSGPETVIKDRIITVTPPAVHDTVRVTAPGDSVIIATKVVQHDTVAQIKYYPKLQYMDYKIQPDTIRLHYADTVKQTIVKNAETPLLSKLGLILIGAVLAAAAMFVLKFK